MTDEEIERLLVEMTRPLAERILSRYSRSEGTIRPQDAEDILSTVQMRVVRTLRSETEVRDLDDYVATLTYNAIHDHFRRRYPERTRLRNRLRYMLTHDPRLALWSTENGLMAGIAQGPGRSRPRAPDKAVDELVEILRAEGKPIPLDDLVHRAAALWGIADLPPDEREPAAPGELHAQLEQREFLRALWREIRLLPPRQRQALLLNLRGEETASPISLLALTGTATFDEIAATMELTVEELAAVWNDLPLDDLRIAESLGVTRQQVINLRKSARARLARRVARKR